MKLKHNPRPYDFRVFGSSTALLSLKEAHVEYNEVIARLEDFWLTACAGVPLKYGVDQSSRVALALTYFIAETKEGPMSPFQGKRILSSDPLSDLRALLTDAGVTDVDSWINDCRLAFQSPLREDAVWVNRRAMFARDFPTDCGEAIYHAIVDLLQPDFLERSESGEDTTEHNYRQAASNLISKTFGDGAKKDRSVEYQVAQACVAWLDTLKEGDEPRSRDALPEILAIAQQSQEAFDAVCGRGSPSALTLWLRAHKIDPSKKRQPTPQQQRGWDQEAQRKIRKVCAKVEKTYQKHLRTDLSWMRCFKDTLFPQFKSQTVCAPPTSVALVTVFSHHTKVVNQELQRIELAQQANALKATFSKHVQGVAFLRAHVQERRVEHPTYQLRPAAITGWGDLKKAFEGEQDPKARKELARQLPHQQRKAGDVQLFEVLASDEGKTAWPVLKGFTEWLSLSEKSAHRRVPTFLHRTADRGSAPLSFSGTDWACKIHEDPHGKHTATLTLFGDKNRTHTVAIRNHRADVELCLGDDRDPTTQGRHGSLGTLPEGGRPYLGGSTTGKALSKMSWAFRYKHGIPYLKFTPQIGARKVVSKISEAEWFVGVDMGLRAPLSYTQMQVVQNPDELFKQHAKTLVPTHFKDKAGKSHLSSLHGTIDGKRVVFRRIGNDKNETRWVRVISQGTIRPQGDKQNRKTSSREYQFTVSLVKRAGRRTPVKARLADAQRVAVQSTKRIVFAHKELAKTIHYLRTDARRGIPAWQTLSQSSSEYTVRKTAARHWERIFGAPVSKDQVGALPKRLAEVAQDLESIWMKHEKEIGDLVEQVESWIAPSAAQGPGSRYAGGLSDTRLMTVNNLRKLIASWEGRPTPEDPRGQRFRDWRPPRLTRLDEYLQRKKEEQKKQAVAELFRRLGDNCDVLVMEDLQGGGDQRSTRQANRQMARLAPYQVKQMLQDQADLRGVLLLEAGAAYTSQTDLHTGMPALRCGEISVEQFVSRFSFAAKHWAANPSPKVRAAQKAYLDSLYSQWDPKTRVWTDRQGRKWKLKSQVPRLRWEGPGEHPAHVCIPQKHGPLLLTLDSTNALRFANCDQQAAGNVLLSRLAYPWRPFHADWKETTDTALLRTLTALQARELPKRTSQAG